jgi:hypothetical protein
MSEEIEKFPLWEVKNFSFKYRTVLKTVLNIKNFNQIFKNVNFYNFLILNFSTVAFLR